MLILIGLHKPDEYEPLLLHRKFIIVKIILFLGYQYFAL